MNGNGGGLGGFLFGNIDEEGHLDNEDLDDDIRASLSSFVEKGFGLAAGAINLTALGIEESELSKTNLDHDYCIDEDAGQDKNFIYDNGQNDHSKIRFTDLFSLGRTAVPEMGLKRVRVKRRFIQNKSLHYTEDSVVFMRAPGSIPHAQVPSKHRLFIAFLTGGPINTLSSMSRRKIPLNQRLLDSFYLANTSGDLSEVPCLEEPMNVQEYPLTSFHPLQLLQWEDCIVDCDDLPQKIHSIPKLAPIYADIRREVVNQKPVQRHPIMKPISPHSATISALASVAPAALSALIAQQRRLSPSPTPSSVTLGPVLRNPASRICNLEIQLSNGWLEAVIWDEGERPPSNYPVSLQLNLNDPQLLVDISTEGDDTLANKKLTRTERILHKKIKRLQSTPNLNPSARPQAVTNYSRPVADRFNLSNDKFYELKPTVQKSAGDGKAVVRSGLQHSIPALKLLPPHFSTYRDKAELRAWHRPKLTLGSQISFFAVKLPKKKSNHRVGQVIRNSKKLTLRDASPYLSVEYSEEFPLLMQNPGMSTHLLLYYRKRSTKDTYVPTDPSALLRVLEPTDPSPLWTFGDVAPGQALYLLSNNLFRAPLFQHTPPPTDFLAIRNIDKTGTVKYYLRELDKLFLAGQVFPLVEIFGPHSRKHNLFCRNRLQVAAYRLFQKDQADRKRLKASRLSKAFPQFSEGSIRKWLKEYAESQRSGSDTVGTWLLKTDAPSLGEDELRALVNPEQVCLYEAMMAGQQRLLDSGLIIEPLVDDRRDEDSIADDSASQVEEVTTTGASLSQAQSAPWNLSLGFLNTNNGAGMVQLEGPGDPSGRGEMFSFVKGCPPSLQVAKVTDDSSLADIFRKSRNNVELQTLYNQQKKRIWEGQVKTFSSKDIPLTSILSSMQVDKNTDVQSTASNSKEHRLVIERIGRNEQGEEVHLQEEINDPRIISIYLRQRRQFEIKRKRRANAVLAATASKQRKKKQREEQILLTGGQSQPKSKPKPPATKRKEVNVRCGACGAIGHMRTNRVCPLFTGDPAPTISGEAPIKVEGTKLSINAEALHRIVEQEKSFKLKLQLGQQMIPSTTPSPPPKPPRRKRSSPTDAFISAHPHRKELLQEFNLQLTSIVDKLLAEPDSWPFHRPVSRRDYPHYYRMIPKPVDLGSIRSLASKQKFLYSSELVSKVQLMANNCLQFNRADHVFTSSAFKLLEMVKLLCAEVLSVEQQLHSDLAQQGGITGEIIVEGEGESEQDSIIELDEI